jgi:hypothetical protein
MNFWGVNGDLFYVYYCSCSLIKEIPMIGGIIGITIIQYQGGIALDAMTETGGGARISPVKRSLAERLYYSIVAVIYNYASKKIF